ncbi:MAG: hypothetical protein ACR2PA_19080, partial [Hyphomicrobiaceae bacterium]
VVCAIARTGAFRRRPQLIVPLLPYLGETNLLDLWSRIDLAPIVRQAGHGELAYKLIKPLIREVTSRACDYPWVQVQVGRELNELGQPQRALRMINRSRPRSVRSWKDEQADRLLVAADALRALHRPYQALALYRIARDVGSNDANRPMAALEHELGLDANPAA